MNLPEWLRQHLYGWSIGYRVLHPEPDFVIGGKDNPYMWRWYVVPRNRWFNVYLHEFRRSDDDRALHDHPWLNLSVVLHRGYFEVTPQGRFMRGPGALALRSPWARHRVELGTYPSGQPQSAVTLFLTGPKVRDWGFWCPQGWVPWQRFTAPGDSSRVGLGCDQPTVEGP